MDLKLVALDLDGTLIDHTGSIGPLTLRALKTARERGIYVVIATGRALRSAMPDCEVVRPHFIVASHGATLYDSQTRRVVWARTISGRIVADAIGAIGPFDVWPRVHTLNELFIAESDMDKTNPYVRGERCFPVKDRLSLPREALMLGIAGKSPEAVWSAGSEVENLVRGMASVHRGNTLSFDVVAYGVSKLEALLSLTAMLRIERTAVVAFGDGLNDAELLAWAGLGMAVEGAPDAVVRAASGRTIPDRDGVGVALLDLLGEV